MAQDKEFLLTKLNLSYKTCNKCPLATLGRSQVVFGHGNPNSTIMFIGEAPGRDEDLLGLPFIGRSGKLLTKIILDMGLMREHVYITNIAKCRPPKNRQPTNQERETCKKLILFKEIEIIKPKVICTLGSLALNGLLGNKIKISEVRGTFCTFQNIPVMPTYHPAYLLRNPSKKTIVTQDMQKIMSKLEELLSSQI
ncbi:MAG: uracil-DNA glycosylase [bacterium]